MTPRPRDPGAGARATTGDTPPEATVPHRCARPAASPGAALSSHAFDAATLLTQILLFATPAAGHRTIWLHTYIWVYLLFCLGIWLKQYDPQYVSGATRLAERHPDLVTIGVYVASLAVGAMATGSLLTGAIPGLTGRNVAMALRVPLTLGLAALYPVLFARALRRGRAHTARLRPASALALRVVSDLAIFLLTQYLLTFVLYNLAEMRGRGDIHGVMALLMAVMTAILLTLCYLPGRIHSLMQDPESRANWWSFWITCAAAGAFAVWGVHVDG